jgi:hypothetical protein
MKQFLIEERLLQAIFEFLIKQPMVDVEHLVVGIRQTKPVDAEPE